jgi:hypothetical protein
MKFFKTLESVGWIFWLVLFVLLIYPAYLTVKAMTYTTATTATRIGFGIFSAAIVSAVISAGVNELLFRWRAKIRNEKRKVERKDKRKRRK